MQPHWVRTVLVVGAAAAVVTGVVSPAHPAVASPAASPAASRTAPVQAPPTPAQCRDRTGSTCYGPRQLLAAYGVTDLQAAGIDGRGRTICVLDSFGSPTVHQDLHEFSRAYGLPDARLTVVAPAGRVPAYDGSAERAGWAGETSLDVQWAHAFAPRAAIRLIVTPTAETEGLAGFPEMATALASEIGHDRCDVVSMSFGATEPTFDTPRQILQLRQRMFVPAARRGVTLVAASGDAGATDFRKDGRLYRSRVDSWPSTDPLVTSVGGTRVQVDDAGRRTSPDVAWGGGSGAGGGGQSAVFPRPSWQDPVRSLVGTRRGTPDLAMLAAPETGVVVRETFDRQRTAALGPWAVEGGTSAATPMFAGIVALADQRAGRRVGQLGPLLYGPLQRGPGGAAGNGIVDVRAGRTDVTDHAEPDGSLVSVRGHTARLGYDLATGLGTVDAAKLVPALSAAAQAGMRR